MTRRASATPSPRRAAPPATGGSPRAARTTATRRTGQAAPDARPEPAGSTGGPVALNTTFLESLVGYNARRASLHILGVFFERMAAVDLRPVDFSVLVLIGHNPGITSRQLCQSLAILPPNLVGLVNALVRRKLVDRQPHPTDGRAHGLYLTRAGQSLLTRAEATATALEVDATPGLTANERRTLIGLLQKVYRPE